MKKLVSLACAMALVMTMSLTAFAAGSFDPATGINDDVTLNTTTGGNSVPVYGYIGEDAELTDPDPTDPSLPPVVDPSAGTDMELSVPVKLMWAAFASDGGSVTSPDYTIENKSLFAVDVEMTSFTQTNGVSVSGLTLNLVGASGGMTSINDVLSASATAFGTLDAAAGINAERGFSVGGSYTGSFATVLQPEYSMVLTFSIH